MGWLCPQRAPYLLAGRLDSIEEVACGFDKGLTSATFIRFVGGDQRSDCGELSIQVGGGGRERSHVG